MSNKNLKDLSSKEIAELYNMVQDEFSKMCDIIERKSGYYTNGAYSLLIP